MNQYLLIGEVLKPQGIRGELKLRAESEDITRYERLTYVFVKNGDAYERRRVIKGRANGDFAYLQIEGISDRNGAEAMRGQMIYVDRSEAIDLDEGKYFICDLVGIEAYDQNGKDIGVLRDIQSPNPYSDVYIFETDRGEMMMPALARAIKEVDVDSRKMILNEDVLEEIALWPDSQEIREE